MLKQAAKSIFYSFQFKTGFYKRRPKEHQRLILMYHGISSNNTSVINARHLPKAQFEKQLIYLKEHFTLVSLEEMAKEPVVGSKPAITLTFDDGFENNLTNALPLLEKHKVSAAFFIPTIAFDSGILPSDKIDIIRSGSTENIFHFDNATYTRKGKHRLVNKNSGENMYEALMRITPPEREIELEKFYQRYRLDELIRKTDPEYFRLMNAQQVKELSNSPFATIGSHTHSHFALTACADEEVKNELSSSKTKLEAVIGKAVTSIAYPYGDYIEKVIALSEAAGYKTLLAAGTVAYAKKILPRLGVISGGTFEQNMLNVHKGFGGFGF